MNQPALESLGHRDMGNTTCPNVPNYPLGFRDICPDVSQACPDICPMLSAAMAAPGELGDERWPEIVETQARRVDGNLAVPVAARSRSKEVG